MDPSFKVIAIISAFNEADIISPVIGHLVENEIDVYLIDNHSSDGTVQQAAQWLGKGLLHIELFPERSKDASKFDWTAILRRKEELAQTLQANWFIHHDADEFRESPWSGLSLNQAIQWVDKLGYNCIDFKVLNFPPVDDDYRRGDDPKTYFKFYEEASEIDRVQRKAWKATGTPVSLARSGGHEAQFHDRQVFPLKFLLRHYPIRGQTHGIRKVFGERKSRFLETERLQGWHVQYDGFLGESHSFLKDRRCLVEFDLDKARFDLLVPKALGNSFAAMQGERDELRRHATNLEIEFTNLTQHTANLERERNELRQHTTNLEVDRTNLAQDTANLEREREQLKVHSANLERERGELQEHAKNLETDRADLRQHARKVDTELRELSRQVATLRAELTEMSVRASSLDQSRQWLEERNAGLERELEQIRDSFVWRSTSFLRRLLLHDDPNETYQDQHSSIELPTIFSSLDIPAQTETTVSETCLLRGWTCSSSGVESVKIFIDGEQVHQFLPDLDRPDVALVHPTIPGAARSGFDLTIQLGPRSHGVHRLELVIRDRAGAECRHERSLMVDGNPYHRVLLAKQLSNQERNNMLRAIAASGHSPRFELWIDARVGGDISHTLSSIAAQTYPDYACHIVGHESLEGFSVVAGSLPEELQRHSSFAPAIADGNAPDDYLAVLFPGERLMPDALLHLASILAKGPTPLLYADHDRVQASGIHCDPDYAPDWSPEHLLSRDYVGGVYFARRAELRQHGLDAAGDAWRYDLLLRITESADRIIHIPQVLWSSPETDPRRGGRHNGEFDAIKAALARRCVDAEVTASEDVPVRRVRRRIAVTPKVSIIIPTTGRLDLVRTLVESLSSTTWYSNYELLFLDNGRGEHLAGLEFLRSKGLRVIERNEPFNWARINNAGARACDGELLLFLNDDIEIIEPAWLEELVSQVLVADVGTVGALLHYPDGQIQHAGVFLVDHGGGCRHYLQRVESKNGVYQYLDRVVREVTASTGACLMVRRDVFEEIGGFDEDFCVAFNDTDFCMRLAERGYRNLWTPYCRLIHHESLSRKGTNIGDDEQRVWNRWAARLRAGDAYHNANLAKDRADCAIDTAILNPKPVATKDTSEGTGVNLIGYIRAEMGLGEAARGLARAMEATGIPFIAIDYEYGNPARKGDSTWSHRIVERPVHPLNILNVNADLTPEACRRLGSEVFEGRYTIGYWVWELPEFPDRWLSSFDHVKEVWVPSDFVREAVARKSEVPVIRIPHVVEKGCGPFLERAYFHLPDKHFLFLSMYDTHSVMERKNPAGTIAAFREAFPPSCQDVGLIVKVNNFDERTGDKIRELIGDRQNIYLIDRTLSRYEVDSLLTCCDSFVSLHRSEGFGLPIAEAMVLGRPVIATYWSGNVDFMDETCAGCVDFEITELGQSFGPYDAHQHWAEPNIECAARWMRRLYAEPALVRRLGAAGKKKIEELLSPRTVGELIRMRLLEISANISDSWTNWI